MKKQRARAREEYRKQLDQLILAEDELELLLQDLHPRDRKAAQEATGDRSLEIPWPKT